MDKDLYDRIESQQEEDLLSEVDQLAPIIQHDYRQMVLKDAKPIDVRPAMDRIANMETHALDVYEEGLLNKDIPFNQRKQVADKVLEITGIIDKNPGKGSDGNTFVFSDSFAEKFLKAAGKMQHALREVSDEL